MKKLMVFEGNKVDIITVDGQPMFEVYSTGMALGQAYSKILRNGERKLYPKTDRIDQNLKNAEITPCVRNAHKYLTESQLYDLMLEMKTEKVKPFRKWVTGEVLPSIRKTGTYSVGQSSPPELPEPYAYVEKFFRKRQAVTILDLAHFTGITRHNLFYYFTSNREKFSPNDDYLLLQGEPLNEFKRDNPSTFRLVSSVIIFFKSGVDKLAKIIGVKAGVMPYIAPVPVAKAELIPAMPSSTGNKPKPDKKLSTNIPGSYQAQECIKALSEQIQALGYVIKQFNQYNDLERHQRYAEVLKDTCGSITMQGFSLAAIKPSLIDVQF